MTNGRDPGPRNPDPDGFGSGTLNPEPETRLQSLSMGKVDQQPWYAQGLQFTCQQCGNCCTGPPGYVWMSDEEATQIAAYLNLSEAQLRARYAHKALGRWSLNENATDYGYDCVFLERDETGKALCSIYPVRPQQCRTWPFWAENLKSTRAWKRAARHCQGMAQGLEDQGKFFPLEQIRILRDRTPDI